MLCDRCCAWGPAPAAAHTAATSLPAQAGREPTHPTRRAEETFASLSLLSLRRSSSPIKKPGRPYPQPSHAVDHRNWNGMCQRSEGGRTWTRGFASGLPTRYDCRYTRTFNGPIGTRIWRNPCSVASYNAPHPRPTPPYVYSVVLFAKPTVLRSANNSDTNKTMGVAFVSITVRYSEIKLRGGEQSGK